MPKQIGRIKSGEVRQLHTESRHNATVAALAAARATATAVVAVEARRFSTARPWPRHHHTAAEMRCGDPLYGGGY